MNHHCLENVNAKTLSVGKAAHFLQTVKDPLRHKYFEAQDLVISCMKARFDQPGYKKFRNVEELLVKGVQSDNGN